MPNKPYHTRFAPSPTGNLHLGHAYSALFAYRKAAVSGGTFTLRIENIDAGRCSSESEQGIYEDLSWLGITWQTPVMRQSERTDAYRAALEKLDTMGILYPCFCSRKDILNAVDNDLNAPHSFEGPLYPGTCKHHISPAEIADKKAAGLPYSVRLDAGKAFKILGAAELYWHDAVKGKQPVRPEMFGDIILARKDTPTTYHLSVTIDDAAQGINLITRGEDLFPATHPQRLLQALLGLETPEYHHHPLISDENGKRIAKRDNPLTLRQMRERGVSADEVRGMIEKENKK